MANVISSSQKTLVAVSDAYSILASPNSCVIHSNYNGTQPILDNAYTDISVIRGGEKVSFKAIFQSSNNSEIKYSLISNTVDKTVRLQITQLPADIVSGYLEFPEQVEYYVSIIGTIL